MNPANLDTDIELSVSDFVALHNQIMEYAMPRVVVVGELANLRVSKNRWLHFDLKDAGAKVHFFGTVYHLPGPLEDGMKLKVAGAPRLSPQYGFSINVQSIQMAGEGSIKRAQDLLKVKLTQEGLFAPERKRLLPQAPERIGLITSSEAAAYQDFLKVSGQRWNLNIQLADVAVQGESAPPEIVQAITDFNALAEPPEILVITRGGGSADDLASFSDENVVRAVAASRIPTLVAVGHERDVSLAELAADQRASTPSNAAELLTPNRREVQANLTKAARQLDSFLDAALFKQKQQLDNNAKTLDVSLHAILNNRRKELTTRNQMLEALSPAATLRRGYAIVTDEVGQVVRSKKQTKHGQRLNLQLSEGQVKIRVE